MKTPSKYAMTLVVVVGIAVMMAAAAVSTSTFSAYGYKRCDSSGSPPFKDLPGASGSTGNPHTCEQPTGDPHDDPDNNQEGNPHNTD